jgi:ABC-type transport system involved in multi-copper enzyme maturation permease subunit
MLRIRTIAWIIWLEVIRRKDVYVLLVMLGALLVTIVSLDIFGLGGVVRYVTDIGLLMVWIFGWILAISVGSRQLPQEESRGTIFSLLAKPITRFEVVTGKWLGSWTIVSASTILFYSLVIGVVLVKGGRIHPVALLQGCVLHSLVLGIISAVAIAFSTRMNKDAAASISYVLTAAAFVVVPRIPEFMTREVGLRGNILMFFYNLMPHFEVFDMRKRIVHDYGPVEWKWFALVTAYGVALISLFLLMAWVAYRKKCFSREELV